MAINKRGKQSFVLPQLPVIQCWASVAGKKESEGPLAHTFDVISQDTYFGQKTWEQAEKRMQQMALDKLAEKSGLHRTYVGMVERMERNPSLLCIYKIANGLGVSPKELFED